LNFYGPLDVNDPESFIAGIGAVLAQYPPELIAVAVDATGIPLKLKTLRNLAEIDEVCQALYEPIERRIWRERIASAPGALPRPPRSLEEQARIDAQVEAARKQIGAPGPKAWIEPVKRGDGRHIARVQADLAQRRVRREGSAA
jgi:hypothetical protein